MNPDEYRIVFSCDKKIIFSTQAVLTHPKDDIRDTAILLSTGLAHFREAVRDGLSPESFRQANLATLQHPSGTTESYDEEAMQRLFDEACELDKIKPTRNSRLILTSSSSPCFAGGDVNEPLDIILDALREDDFLKVCSIVDLLQTRRATLEPSCMAGVYYEVRLGHREWPDDKLKVIHETKIFSSSPIVVEELEDIFRRASGLPQIPRFRWTPSASGAPNP